MDPIMTNELRRKKSLLITRYNEDVARRSPHLGVHQGFSIDGSTRWTIDNNVIQRRDADWNVLASNTTPRSGVPGALGHLGDCCYYNGKLYVAGDNYTSFVSSANETVIVYDATTLAYVTSRDVTADGPGLFALSGVAVRPDEGVIYGISYTAPTQLFRWDAATLAYLGTIELDGGGLRTAQGLSWNPINEQWYISSAEGFISTWSATGAYMGVVVRADTDINANIAYEGLDVTTGEIAWLVQRSVSDQKVCYYTVPETQKVDGAGLSGIVLPGKGAGSGIQFGRQRRLAALLWRIADNTLGVDGKLALIRGQGAAAAVFSIYDRNANGNTGGVPDMTMSADAINLGARQGQSPDFTLSRTAVGVGGTPNQFRATDGVATRDLGAVDGLTDAQIDAKFTQPPTNGMLATGTSGGAPVMLIRRSGVWTATTGGGGGTVTVPDRGSGYKASLPTGAFAQTFDRRAATLNNAISLNGSGQLQLVGIDLISGEVVTDITFFAGGTAMAGGSHMWFSLVDISRNVLAKTADDTSATWAASTSSAPNGKTLPLSSPFTATYTGLHYVGIVVVATTLPTLLGSSDTNAHAAMIPPIITGASTTGLTDPASLGATAATLANTSRKPYAYVR